MNIPPPSLITSEQAQSLNLIKHVDFICGQNIIDKPIEGQKFALISTIPCKGATPDENGNYAFSKVRGVYSTLEASEKAAEEIVRTQDQLCVISIIAVGKPYPIRASTDLPETHTIEVDVRDSTRKAYKNFAKSQREEDERIQQELQAKEKALKADASEPIDDETDYCLLRSKMAHWCHMISEFNKNKQDVEGKILEGHKKILEMDQKHPEYQHSFLEKIQQEEARSGFEFGKTEEMDKMLKERSDKLVHYKKYVKYLFPEDE